MTPDEFKAAYMMGHALTEEGVKTSLAQEIRKGRLVMVHELSATTADEQRRLAILLAQLPPKDKALVLGDVDVEGMQLLITKYVPGFTSLREWLERSVAASSTVVADTKDNPPTMDLAVHDVPKAYPSPAGVPVIPSLDDTTVRPSVKRNEPPSAEPPPMVEPPVPSTESGQPRAETTASFTQLFGPGERPSGLPVPPPRATVDTGVRPEEPAVPPDEQRGSTAEFEILFGKTDPGSRPTAEPIDAAVPEPPKEIEDSLPPMDTSRSEAPRQPPAPTESFTQLFGDVEPDAARQRIGDAPRDPPRVAPGLATSAPSESSGVSFATGAPEESAPLLSRRPIAPQTPQPNAPVVSPAAKGPAPPKLKLDALGGSPPPEAPRPGAPVPELVPRRAPERLGFPKLPSFDKTEQTDPGSRSSDAFATLAPKSPAAPPPDFPAAPLEGSYTEVLTPARVPQFTSPAPPQSGGPAAPAPPRPSYMPLIITLSLLVLLAAAIVIVILVLKK